MVLHEIKNKIRSCSTISDNSFYGWCVCIKDYMDCICEIKEILSAEEIIKNEAMFQDNARQMFCLRKGITRILLSNYLDIAPKEVDYCYTEYGKPFFLNEKYKNIYFNISHSKEFIMVAITEKRNIGVDVEKINLTKKVSVMAESVFSQDELKIFKNCCKDEKLQLFYETWVKKEAISKAVGVGISLGFNTFSAGIDNKSYNNKCKIRLNDNDKYLEVFNACTKEYHYAIAIEL
jgi:4'-phosphopantetheinyl transferase